jgi:cell division protein FtsB
VTARRGGGRGSSADRARPDSRAATPRRSSGPRPVEVDDGPARPGPLRRAIRKVGWPILLTALVAVTVGLGAIPTRTYLERRQEVALAQQQVDNLIRENDQKQARVDQLQTPEEVEAIARSEYQLVLPGEESYEVLPPPQEPVQLPEGWPFDLLDGSATAPG